MAFSKNKSWFDVGKHSLNQEKVYNRTEQATQQVVDIWGARYKKVQNNLMT